MHLKEKLGQELGLNLDYLWDWQPEAIEFVTKNRKCVLPIPTGAGKSVIACLAMRRVQVWPVVILCSGNALYTWWRHIKEYLPDLLPNTYVMDKKYAEDAEARKHMWAWPDAKIIIAKGKTWQYDNSHGYVTRTFKIVIVDEFHRMFRKRSTTNKQKDLVERLKFLCSYASYAWLLSATPISKGRQDYWTSLNLLYPKIYTSYWRFVNQFCDVSKGIFGLEIGGPINNENFRRLTWNHIFRPSKPIVMPEVVRQVLPYVMEDWQKELYDHLEREMWIEFENENFIVTYNVLAKITRLRQLLCCPAIFDPKLAVGGAAAQVLDHMEEDSINRTHVVWYVPFVDAIPHFKRHLLDKGYKNVIVFQAGMDMDELKAAEEGFRTDRKAIAIVSIAYAQSFRLETAEYGYFIGYDWDPIANKQAEGRQMTGNAIFDSLKMFYCQALGTQDDVLLKSCNIKEANTRLDMSDIQAFKTIFQPKNTT